MNPTNLTTKPEPRSSRHGRTGAAWASLLTLFGALTACQSRSVPMSTGETHFLSECSTETCADGLECLCGVCSVVCEEDADCVSQSDDATCVNGSGAGATCSDALRLCDVTCTSDANCESLGDDYVCDDGACRFAGSGAVTSSSGGGGAGGDGDGGADGGDDNSGGAGRGGSPFFQGGAAAGGAGTGGAGTAGDDALGSGTCSDGCFETHLFPVQHGLTPSCVDTLATPLVACACPAAPNVGLAPPTNGTEACKKRLSDGTIWSTNVGGWLDPAEWGPCEDFEGDQVSHSCEVVGCAVPAPSVCSFEETCAALDCGGTQFDEHGCERPSCMTDADCDRSEVCEEANVLGFCSSNGDSCACTTPNFSGVGASFCNPRDDAPSDPGALCDGTDDVRLMFDPGGGLPYAPYPIPGFLSPDGPAMMIIDGQCSYWVQGPVGVWRSGSLTETDAADIVTQVSWSELPNWDWYGELGVCSDGPFVRIQTQEDDVFCHCQCLNAPEGLPEATAAATSVTGSYVGTGELLAGPVRALVMSFGDGNGQAREDQRRDPVDWPFAWDVDSILVDPEERIAGESGVVIDDLEDAEALRALREANRDAETGSLTITVRDESGAEYALLVRDELPEAIKAGIAELSSHLP
jgi:hypothetical protein